MSLSPQFLDELRARTLLSALVGKSIKITKAGREFKGCCPFHNEKTPSFYVNDEKGFYHCLAAETRVMTNKGRIPISELSGAKHEVLTRGGQWVTAQFRPYGKQPLWKISLSRNGVKKEIFATSGHRWFVHDRRSEYTTQHLKKGHALQTCLPATSADWTIDSEGVRHGIVFGDGSMYKQVYGTLNLHGDKDAELRHWFPAQEHHIHERPSGALYLRVYGGRAFENMKRLPLEGASDAYLRGFLAGYLAADGHVAKDGTVMLNSANAETLESVRDIATQLGISTYGRTTLMRKGYGQFKSALHRIHFVTSNLSHELFLLSKARDRFIASNKKFDRLRWVVQSVEKTMRVETVYCAEVPDEHAFTLEDNILTGNCFGCSAHGDAIRWMTDQRGLPFMDAVKELAQAAGMDVPAPDPRDAERAARASSLYDVMTAAADWFSAQLQGIEGANARSYLDQRGLKPDTIKAFNMGYAPDSRGKLKTALTRFGEEALIEAGLLIKVDDKESYDRFRGRLMIPIRDPRGRVIAFGGRILGSGEPKYLNSPDTPLFDKGHTLYNLDLAAPAARKANRIIVVEGYMDVIALAQAGIGEAVAPLGTALTEAQLERLWRHAEVPILCFDGDAPGQKASIRAALRAFPALGPGRSLSFATLPQGQDPDDLVKSGGAAAMERLLAEPEPLVERLWRHERDASPLRTPEDKAGLRRRLTEHAQTITNPDVRAQYLAEFRGRFETQFLARRDMGRKNAGRRGPYNRFFEQPVSGQTKSISGAGIAPVYAKAIMAGLLHHPVMLHACGEALSELMIDDNDLNHMRATLIDAACDNADLDPPTILTICDSAGLGALAKQLTSANGLAFSFNGRQADAEVARRDLATVIEALAARPQLDAALAEATARLAEDWNEGGFAEQMRLRVALDEANSKLIELSQGDSDTI